jgi:hypothetical protein
VNEQFDSSKLSFNRMANKKTPGRPGAVEVIALLRDLGRRREFYNQPLAAL